MEDTETSTTLNILERMLLDEHLEPRDLPFSLLESITNGFSDDQKIGTGGFAVVYEGRLRNGTVAVKNLFQTLEVDETKFIQEVDNLMKVKHENIVRFLGYCADAQGKVFKYEGKSVIADERQRLLCFEFLPEGSLDKYISDASEGLEWRTRYHIIKGICEGLHYLHQQKIVHLDLKPANILLNHYMVPKIADFGLSKCFDETQTQVLTLNLYGSRGYMAPEFYGGVITFKSDIYSLGIIITEMLTGRKGYPDMENVLESWRTRFQTSQEDIRLEYVRVCAEIGIECMHPNPVKRPDAQSITERLHETEYTYPTHVCSYVPKLMDMSAAPSQLQQLFTLPEGRGERSNKAIFSLGSTETTMLLDIRPLELRFPFEPNECITCTVTVTNRTNHYVDIWITPTADTSHCFRCQFNQKMWCPGTELGDHEWFDEKDRRRYQDQIMLQPHSTWQVGIKTYKLEQLPVQDDIQKLEVLMIIIKSKECLSELQSSLGTYTMSLNMDREFLKRVNASGGEVHRAMLTAAIYDPARPCPMVDNIPNHKFIPIPSAAVDSFLTEARSIDMHPSEPWVLVILGLHMIWLDYETQVTIQDVNYISSAKFIAREQWIAMGDSGNGVVRIIDYTTKDLVMEIKTHTRRHRDDWGLTLLAVHPTEPFLLTWRQGRRVDEDDTSIKLWDWSQGWSCTRQFNCHGGKEIRHLMFNPTDANIFATNSYSDVKVWNIHSSEDPISTLERSVQNCAFYTDSGSHRTFLITYEAQIINILDLQTEKHFHKIVTYHQGLGYVACHPTLPILALSTIHLLTAVHHIYLWDMRTCRLIKKIDSLPGSPIEGMVFTGTTEMPRLMVPCKTGFVMIAM